jgi:glucosamine--fructose-6-phosphate aminotransferase (isomerizing)
MSMMESEAKSAHQAVRRQLERNQAVWEEVSRVLEERGVTTAVTLARGSSDHAAAFGRYLFEVELGLLASSAAPSVYTVYERDFLCSNCLLVSISQSGQSPDLCAPAAKAAKAGAVAVALVNGEDSPLAAVSGYSAPLLAGEERSVAATKSYIASLAALLHFTAVRRGDQELLEALRRLPDALAEAADMDWGPCVEALKQAKDVYTLGRGYGFAVALEGALKLKETSAMHAEAFSSAEVLHGPFELVRTGFPVLIFAQNDASLPGVLELVERMTSMGAQTILALPEAGASSAPVCSMRMPLPESLHPLLDPLLAVQGFYIMAARLAEARGLDPDHPHNLSKVTRTK